jgi:hypothetical protein
MKIKIKVIPNSNRNGVVENGEIKVYVKASPTKGKANKEVIEILAKYFKVKKNQIKIVKGEKLRKKIVEIG